MFWKLNDEDLYLAHAGDASATERVYAAALPPCGRIAATLCGDAASAGKVIKRLVDRSPDAVANARDAAEAGRWFMHQTVLLCREQPQAADVETDTLMHGVGGPDVVAYRALVAGIRKLPRQQQEALLLTHAQDWNPRLCAVAMDCSTSAVETHLGEATRQLTPLAGGHFAALMRAVRQVHQTQPLDLPAPPASVAARVRRRRWTTRIILIVGWLAVIAFLAAVAAGVWWLRDKVHV